MDIRLGSKYDSEFGKQVSSLRNTTVYRNNCQEKGYSRQKDSDRELAIGNYIL